MTPLIHALALQAQDDRETRHVLGDAILESGWFDPRVIALCLPRVRGAKVWRRWHSVCSHPTRDWVIAVQAVLLFGDWPSKEGYDWRIGGADRLAHWPVVARCYRPPPSAASMYAVMRRTWPQQRVPNLIFEQSPFMRLIPTAPASASCVDLKPCERAS